MKPLKSSSAQRAALIKAGKLKLLGRDETLAALRKAAGTDDLGDMVKMVDDGLIQAGKLNGEVVMWLTLEPDQIRIER